MYECDAVLLLLHSACDKCLRCDLQVDAVDLLGRTPLHAASGGGHLAAVQRILAINPWHSPADYNGMLPVHEAAKMGHVSVVHQLLFSGCDHSPADAFG